MIGNKIGGPIRWRLHIPASIERVYQALNTDSGRASFWAESATEVNANIEFQFINGYACRSKIIDRKPPYIFSLDYFGGIARFELISEGKYGTDLYLEHRGVAPKDWIETHAGWLNVLFPLKAWVGHGIDLRNHDPTRTWDHGYADQ